MGDVLGDFVRLIENNALSAGFKVSKESQNGCVVCSEEEPKICGVFRLLASFFLILSDEYC